MAKVKKKGKSKGSLNAYSHYGNDDFIIALAGTGIVLLLAGYFIIRALR